MIKKIDCNIKNKLFNTNPNLFLKEILVESNDKIEISNNSIEIYYPANIKNELYLIFPKITFNIDIIRILDNKKIISLKGHKNIILFVRHFYNSKDNFDYLLSADEDFKVYIWDLTNVFKLKFIINIEYNFNISDSLIIFDQNNTNDYILTTTKGIKNENYSKLFSFQNNGKFIKNISSTNLNKTYYLIRWDKKNQNNDIYIIELCSRIISIYNLLNPDDNIKLKPFLHESIFCSGCILNKQEIDYLFTISYNSSINIINLNNKSFIAYFNYGYNNNFSNIIQWNENYLIITINERIEIFHIPSQKIINRIELNKNIISISLKKIIHPYYGESLLSIGSDSSIKLWSSENIFIYKNYIKSYNNTQI